MKELIDEEEYDNALALMDEGISLAEKKGHPGTVADWKDEKLSLYLRMENNAKVVELAEDLFVNGRDSMKYYHTLKTVIPSNLWREYLDNLLLKLASQQKWGVGHIYAKIYIEEKYWDRLMDYIDVLKKMKTYPGGDKTVERLLTYFKSMYPRRRAMMEELAEVLS